MSPNPVGQTIVSLVEEARRVVFGILFNRRRCHEVEQVDARDA